VGFCYILGMGLVVLFQFWFLSPAPVGDL